MANENQNGNAAAKKSFAAKMKEKVANLEAENAHLKEQLEMLSAEIDSEVEKRIRERIQEKDRYVAKCEQEAEEKLANNEVIMNALRGDKARLNQKILQLEKDNVSMAKELARQKKGLFARIFGK